jgi:CheY-like chemotaxis protein
VLVVDDEPDARDLLAAVLEHGKVKVTTASTAAEALQILPKLRPHVLVSDIGMPIEDGYALIEKVRALAPEEGGRTPAVALTAYAGLEDRTRALMAGFNVHVPKPIDPLELLAVVANLAGQRRSQ